MVAMITEAVRYMDAPASRVRPGPIRAIRRPAATGTANRVLLDVSIDMANALNRYSLRTILGTMACLAGQEIDCKSPIVKMKANMFHGSVRPETTSAEKPTVSVLCKA